MASSLPDELVEIIVDQLAVLPVREATAALRVASSVCRQWYRIIFPRLQWRPCLRAESPLAANAFLKRLQLASSSPSEDDEARVADAEHWRAGLRRLQIIGRRKWRHRATVGKRPALLQPAGLISILNALASAPALEMLVLVELPWDRCGFVGHVKPWPASLTALILLTPLNPSELFALVHNFAQLEHLVISASNQDDVRASPFPFHTISYESPAPYQLRHFGVVCRTLTQWLKTGAPWGERDLRWILTGRSLSRLTSLRLEFADDDDALFLTRLAAEQAPLFDELRLRAMKQEVISECLTLAAPKLRRLHLSSIWGMGLRSTSDAWDAVPRTTLDHLSVDVMRLDGHGPWSQRSAAGLADVLTQIACHHDSKLRTFGSMFFDDGRFKAWVGASVHEMAPDRLRFILDFMTSIEHVPPTFDGAESISFAWAKLDTQPADSLTPPPDGGNWY